MTFYHYRNYLLLAIIALTLHACFSDDDLITDPDARIEFSLDTLRFDTVFTEQGSATRILKLYNPPPSSVKQQHQHQLSINFVAST